MRRRSPDKFSTNWFPLLSEADLRLARVVSTVLGEDASNRSSKNLIQSELALSGQLWESSELFAKGGGKSGGVLRLIIF